MDDAPQDDEALALEAARALRGCGARLVCVDLDATFLSVHTGGAWPGSAAALRPLVRGFFLRLVPLLAAPGGPRVALVTFSPQEALVRELLALCFPPEVARAVIVRADCAGWSVSRDDAAAFLPLWQAAGRYADRRFKLPFLVSAAREASADGGRQVRNCHTVLIDDDAANVRVARDCGVLALFFDADVAKIDPRRAEREFCSALKKMSAPAATPPDSPGKSDAEQQHASPAKSDANQPQDSPAKSNDEQPEQSPAKSLHASPQPAEAPPAAPKSSTPAPLDATPPRPPSGRSCARSSTSSSRRRHSARIKQLGLAGTPTESTNPSPSTRRRRVGRVLRDILNTTANSTATNATDVSVTKSPDVAIPDVVRLLATSEAKFLVPGVRSSSAVPPTSSKASGGSATRVSRFHLCTPSPVMKLKYTVDMGRPRSKRATRPMRSCTRSIDGELREHEPEPERTPTAGILRLDGSSRSLASPATSPPTAARVMQPLFEAASPPAAQ